MKGLYLLFASCVAFGGVATSQASAQPYRHKVDPVAKVSVVKWAPTATVKWGRAR